MLLENIDRRTNPGWLINSNCIMQSVADRADGRARKRRGRRVERRKKIMRNIPIRGHLCSTLFYSPCRSPPPPLLLFFLHSRPFIRRPQYRQERHPLARGGPSRLFHCSRKGCLKYARLIFLHSFSTRSHLSLSLSFFLSFSPSPLPLSFLVVPAIVRRKSTRYWAR